MLLRKKKGLKVFDFAVHRAMPKTTFELRNDHKVRADGYKSLCRLADMRGSAADALLLAP